MGSKGLLALTKSTAVAAMATIGFGMIASAVHADERPAITVAVQQIVNAGVLDTLREQSNVGSRIFPSIFDTLIEVDRQGDLSQRPGLAESWTRIDDKTIEFKLRKGVKFHNGEEMTAEDVAFSFGPERMWGFAKPGEAAKTGQVLFTQTAGQSSVAPPEVHAVARRLLPGFDRIEIVDPYTVRFHNKTPDVTLEGRLTRTGMNVVSKKAFLASDWKTFSSAPVATGPYKVKEFKPDNVLVLEAHDAYWGGKPPVREIRFVVVPEVAGRVNGLISGQYDFVTDIPPDQIKTIEASSKHEVVGGPVLNHRLVVFDKNHPQLKDPRVRRALTLAIDRKLIVDTLWSGRTTIPQGLQWEHYGPMFIKDWPAPEYNPDLARKLLKEAGYSGEPIPFRVLNNYYANQVQTAQIMQEMWRDVGLTVQIEMKENFQQVFAKGNVPRGVRDWSNSAGFDDPVSSIVTQHCPDGQQQQVGEWSNDEFNALCRELETSTDRAKRPGMFRRMLEIIERDDPGYTVLHRTVLFYGKRKDLAWKYSPTMGMDFRAQNLKVSK